MKLRFLCRVDDVFFSHLPSLPFSTFYHLFPWRLGDSYRCRLHLSHRTCRFSFFFFDGSAICCMLYIKYSPKWSSHIYIMLV